MTETIETTAAVLRDPTGPFAIESVALGGLAPSQILVRVAGSGFCHTDVTPRVPQMWADIGPLIAGHEGSGIVEAIGGAVTQVSVGDHVLMSFAFCGVCGPCRVGSPAYCVHFESLNMTGRDLSGRAPARAISDDSEVASRWFGQSSFSEYAVAEERTVVVVDRSLPLQLLGPLGCSMQTGAGSVLNEMKVRPGQGIAIFGAGAVGLAGVMAAKLCGAGEIVVIDRNQMRLELAIELGATRVHDGGDDVVKQVKNQGDGMDYCLETTGVPSLIGTAVDVASRRGRIVLVASTGLLKTLPWALAGKTLTYCFEGSAVPQVFLPELISFWTQGLFPFDRLVTTYPLSEINQAELDTTAGSSIKPVLLPR